MQTVVIQREQVIESMRTFKNEGYDMLMDLTAVDWLARRGEGDSRFEVVYHLYSVKSGRRIRVKVPLQKDNPTIPSATPIWKGANWFEREVYDMFGVNFDGHPNLKRLLLFDEFEGHPLRKDYPIGRRPPKIPTPSTLSPSPSPSPQRGEGTGSRHRFWLNLGPSHPATHGALRVLLELDGEKIRDATPEIGYLHRCFEKESEDHTYAQVIPYTDRLNYVSSLMNNVGYAMAVEKLLNIDIPERAKYIRVLICELSRIMDHLVAIGTNVVDLGALTNYWYTFNVREEMYDWVEMLCGARLTTSYTRIGGVARDLPANTKEYLPYTLKKMDRAIKDVTGLLRKNRIFLDRTRGIGAISAEDAIAYGFTGPCLRACGVPYDVRKAHPYYHYDEFDWDVPVGEAGDTFDRIFVRFEEMRQSASIIEQVLEKIPDGPITAAGIGLPPRHEVYGSIEGLMRHFKIIMDGIRPPAGEVYSYTEAANGELGFYIVSDGGPKPYRIKVRPPCYAIYQAYPELVRGHMIADAIAILGSLNVIAGELDR